MRQLDWLHAAFTTLAAAALTLTMTRRPVPRETRRTRPKPEPSSPVQHPTIAATKLASSKRLPGCGITHPGCEITFIDPSALARQHTQYASMSSRQESSGRATRARQVAEREASRLARPDKPPVGSVVHAKGGSRMSTPFGSCSFADRKSPDASGSQEAEEWCGPFSVARQMIAAREEARRLREEQQAAADPENKASHPLDYLHEQALLEKKRKENPSMNWVGDNNVKDDSASSNYYSKRRSRVNKMRTLMGSGGRSGVPSLFHLCIDYVAKNFEHVETLGVVGHPIRRALCERLVELGEMNGAAFDVLAEKGVDTIELIDCAQVSEDQFCDALKICLPAGLKAIFLKHCGRCFGNQAAKILTDTKDIQLFALSLSGAYILKDSYAADLISATARTLSSIDLTACPLIGAKFCLSIADSYRSEGNCLLELALQNVQIPKEALLSLSSVSLRQVGVRVWTSNC